MDEPLFRIADCRRAPVSGCARCSVHPEPTFFRSIIRGLPGASLLQQWCARLTLRVCAVDCTGMMFRRGRLRRLGRLARSYMMVRRPCSVKAGYIGYRVVLEMGNTPSKL